jgi:hypothetical protein
MRHSELLALEGQLTFQLRDDRVTRRAGEPSAPSSPSTKGRSDERTRRQR